MTDLSTHVEACKKKASEIIDSTVEFVEQIPAGSKITQGELTKKVAERHKTTPDKVYHLVKIVLTSYPGKTIKERGVEAGIYNL